MSHIKAVLAACVLSLAIPIAHAETIYLKNGMYIKVWKTEEKDGQIEYWVGSTKYTISKSAVAKIEAGNGPKVSTRSTAPNPVIGAPPAIQDLTRRDLAPSARAAKHDKLELPLLRDQSRTKLTGPLCVLASCKEIASTKCGSRRSNRTTMPPPHQTLTS